MVYTHNEGIVRSKLGVIVAGALLAAFTMVLSISMSASAGKGTGECVQNSHALAVALLDSPGDTESGKLGDAISDGFFGNEPNLVNTNTDDDLGPNEVDPGSSAGEVVPSQSPGPKLNGGGFLTWGSIVKTQAGVCSVAS